MTEHSFTFLDHLNELRRRVFIALLAAVTGTAVSFFFCDKILSILMLPTTGVLDKIYFFSPAEAFLVKIKVSFLAGIFMTSPIIFGQVWRFISPALYRNEKKAVLPLVFVTSFLFVMGAVFCFYFVMPVALRFLVGQQTEFLQPVISIEHYVSFLSGMFFAFGVAFNIPVFILTLSFFGILSFDLLNRYQRHAVIVIFIAAAALTPGPDIASQLLLALPLLILFELSVLGSKLMEMFRKQKVRK